MIRNSTFKVLALNFMLITSVGCSVPVAMEQLRSLSESLSYQPYYDGLNSHVKANGKCYNNVSSKKPMTVVFEYKAFANKPDTTEVSFQCVPGSSEQINAQLKVNDPYAKRDISVLYKVKSGLFATPTVPKCSNVDGKDCLSLNPQLVKWVPPSAPDSVKPTVKITSVPQSVYDLKPQFTFTGSDTNDAGEDVSNQIKFDCAMDSDTPVSCISPFVVSQNLTAATHIFTVRGTDNAGNISEIVTFATDATNFNQYSWTTKKALPKCEFNTRLSGTTHSNPETLAFKCYYIDAVTATDANYKFDPNSLLIKVNSTTVSGCNNFASSTDTGTITCPPTNLGADGSKTVTLSLTNGNGDSGTDSMSFTLDTTSVPNCNSISFVKTDGSSFPKTGYANSSSIKVTYNCTYNSAPATAFCGFDVSNPTGNCGQDNEEIFNSVSEGSRTFYLKGKDVATGVESTPISSSIIVDTQAPSINCLSHADLLLAPSANINFAEQSAGNYTYFSANDGTSGINASSITCSYGTNPNPTTHTMGCQFTANTAGTYYYFINMADKAGNPGQNLSACMVNVTAPVPPPTLTYNLPTEVGSGVSSTPWTSDLTWTKGDQVVFSWTASDPSGGTIDQYSFQVYMDDGTGVRCKSGTEMYKDLSGTPTALTLTSNSNLYSPANPNADYSLLVRARSNRGSSFVWSDPVCSPFLKARVVPEFYRLIVGNNYSCAITVNSADGKHNSTCWGNAGTHPMFVTGVSGANWFTSGGNPAMQMGPDDDDLVDLAIGDFHTCAIVIEKTSALEDSGKKVVKCWGKNNEFQLGVPWEATTSANGYSAANPLNSHYTGSNWASKGSVTGANSPKKVYFDVGNKTGYENLIPLKITVGYNFSCALMGTIDSSNNYSTKIYCWGSNGKGQLGRCIDPSKSTAASNSFTPDVNSNYIFDFATANPNCENDSTNFSITQGDNNKGDVRTYIPKEIKINSSTQSFSDYGFVRQLEAGSYFVCALSQISGSSGGKVYCWGDNSSSQIGINSGSSAITYPNLIASPVNENGVVENTLNQQIALGGDHACILNNSGRVYCWGENIDKQSTGTLSTILTPKLATKVTIDMNLTKSRVGQVLIAGDKYSCVMDRATDEGACTFAGVGNLCTSKVTHKVRCWGASVDGRSGYFDTNSAWTDGGTSYDGAASIQKNWTGSSINPNPIDWFIFSYKYYSDATKPLNAIRTSDYNSALLREDFGAWNGTISSPPSVTCPAGSDAVCMKNADFQKARFIAGGRGGFACTIVFNGNYDSTFTTVPKMGVLCWGNNGNAHLGQPNANGYFPGPYSEALININAGLKEDFP